MLIINADDWGISKVATDRSLMCRKIGAITSASAMVFMNDSERAAHLALEHGLDVGLHLNLTEMFTSPNGSSRLTAFQHDVSGFLRRNRRYRYLYNPFLRNKCEYLFRAEYDEFVRLYRKPPSHFDGHHHIHLCLNILCSGLIPNRSKIRRHFSYFRGERSASMRALRTLVHRLLKRRYICTDFFFGLAPALGWGRLGRVVELAESSSVELAVHPEDMAEYEYLTSAIFHHLIGGIHRGSYASL